MLELNSSKIIKLKLCIPTNKIKAVKGMERKIIQRGFGQVSSGNCDITKYFIPNPRN